MDLLNISGEESLDLPDLAFGFNDAPAGLVNELTGGFLQAQGDGSVISGFVPAAASGTGPVTIGQDGVRNIALLGQQTGQGVTYGVLTATGPGSQALDISTYAAGTYRIWLRFSRVAAEPQTRTFWSGIDNAEYSKSTNTRLVAQWEARIEVAQPAPEWLAIGTAVVTSQGGNQGNAVTVTDERPLYFEGTAAAAYAPTWGSAADRSGRQTATITSLRRMIDAIKQCLVDIKGPGLQPWYSAHIGGMNIGTRFADGATPVAERLAVGDDKLYMQGDASLPRLAFDGTQSFFQLSRPSQTLNLFLSTNRALALKGGYAALGSKIANFVAPVQPLTVWDFAPFGRVAQFVHNDDNDVARPASISIGSTKNGGGRIDFCPGSLGDFQSYVWSVSTRNTPTNDFSIMGTKGNPFSCLMNDATYGWSTTVQANTVFINALASDGAVRVNKLAVGPSYNPFDDSAVAYFTLSYSAATNQYYTSGAAGPPALSFDVNLGFEITLTNPLPPRAMLFSNSPSGVQNFTCINRVRDSTTINVQVRQEGTSTQSKRDFSLVVFYGPGGTARTATG